MNNNKYTNYFLGLLTGVLATMAVWTYPGYESLLNGLCAVIVLMFAIWYNEIILGGDI
jgi:hypothetical protein